jgi:hypothetical protein
MIAANHLSRIHYSLGFLELTLRNILMTTEKLLENLRKEEKELTTVISYIERALERGNLSKKAKYIVKSVEKKAAAREKKETPEKRLHWSKEPGVNPKKVAAWKRNMSRSNSKPRSML